MPIDSFLTAGERPSGGGGGTEYPSPSPSPGPPSPPSKEWRSHNGRDYFRPLGESEYAYYIPAARDGLGDMFLHASFTTKEKTGMMDRTRIALCWAIIRSRHPLLMSKVIRDRNSNNSSTSVEEPYFWFSPPKDAVKEAKDCLVFDTKSKDDLISNYLNGPRTLSDERMSYLVISNPMESIYDDGHNGQFELFMCAPHFIGDGASLHQCTHEFMTLLASPQSSHDLFQILTLPLNWVDLLPPALESRIQIPSSGIARAAAKVNYLQTMYNEIGGHTLRRTQRSPQKTILVEKSFTESQTKKILAKCKQNGVTVNHALFALCNVAWGQSNLDFKAIREPLMMYTALNLRPFLTPHPSPTYWFVALTYFNIVLPAFVPVTVAAFWNRVRRVKEQTRKVVGSPFLPGRAVRGAVERAERVRGGSGGGGAEEPKSINDLLRRDDHDTGTEGTEKLLPPAPSKALFGLSLIGNLDSIYKQEMYGLYPGNKEGEEEEGAVVESALSSSTSVSASTSTPPGTGTTASTTTLSSLSPSPSVYVSAASSPQPGLPYSPPLPADESFPGSDTAALSTTMTTMTMSPASSSLLPSISTAATSPGSDTSVTSPTTSVTFPHSTSTSTSTYITSPRPSASSASVTSTSTTSTSSHLPKIHIQTVTTASRQKPGGFLLLSHTFDKKMWLHLCWDVNGFEEGHVEKFWECLGDAVEELVICE